MKLKELYLSFPSNKDYCEAVKNKIKELVDKNPDFRYNPLHDPFSTKGNLCRYNKGVKGGPECNGCIFGQALQALGWDDPEELSYICDIGTLHEIFIQELPNKVSIPVSWVVAQKYQDTGNTWAASTRELLSEFG